MTDSIRKIVLEDDGEEEQIQQDIITPETVSQHSLWNASDLQLQLLASTLRTGCPHCFVSSADLAKLMLAGSRKTASNSDVEITYHVASAANSCDPIYYHEYDDGFIGNGKDPRFALSEEDLMKYNDICTDIQREVKNDTGANCSPVQTCINLVIGYREKLLPYDELPVHTVTPCLFCGWSVAQLTPFTSDTGTLAGLEDSQGDRYWEILEMIAIRRHCIDVHLPKSLANNRRALGKATFNDRVLALLMNSDESTGYKKVFKETGVWFSGIISWPTLKKAKVTKRKLKTKVWDDKMCYSDEDDESFDWHQASLAALELDLDNAIDALIDQYDNVTSSKQYKADYKALMAYYDVRRKEIEEDSI